MTDINDRYYFPKLTASGLRAVAYDLERNGQLSVPPADVAKALRHAAVQLDVLAQRYGDAVPIHDTATCDHPDCQIPF